MLVVLLAFLAPATAGEVLPASPAEITFATDADQAVTDALAALRRREFRSAGQQLRALAEAGDSARIRYLEAMAWYEAGEVSLASEAVALAARGYPDDPNLLSLRGLVLADQGRGTDALALLDRARAAAKDPHLLARIGLNRALVHLDRGELDAADADLAGARAQAAGDAELVARVDASAAHLASLRGKGAPPDPLAQVGERLSRGDIVGAKAALAASTEPRQAIQAAIASGSIARAEGRFSDAAAILGDAASDAQAHGLVRERAAALAQLGVVHGANNRWDVARAVLDQAVSAVQGTSFRVLERACRIEAARAAVQAGALDAASRSLQAASALRAADAASDASAAEVEGLLAAKRGDRAAAGAGYDRAIAAHEGRRAWADAARVGTAAVQLAAAGDDRAAVERIRARTLAAFASAGDPLGPAHVGVAQGLGESERKDLPAAMKTFATAAKAAEAVGSERGKAVARIARENAAKTLAELTDDQAMIDQAKTWGLTDLVARYESYEKARKAYDAALVAYDAGRYDEAALGFDVSVRALESLGEHAYGTIARRGRAWAQFNAATAMTAVDGFPVWQNLVEEGAMLGDGELRVRAMGAAALAAQELGRPEAVVSLRAAGAEAEAMGLRSVAGGCRAAQVEVEPLLADKAAAARRAFALLDGGPDGVYALYSAAVAAYEGESYALAAELAQEALPRADAKLAAAIREVLAASSQ